MPENLTDTQTPIRPFDFVASERAAQRTQRNAARWTALQTAFQAAGIVLAVAYGYHLLALLPAFTFGLSLAFWSQLRQTYGNRAARARRLTQAEERTAEHNETIATTRRYQEMLVELDARRDQREDEAGVR